MRAGGFFMIYLNANIVDEAIIDRETLLQSQNNSWLFNHEAIIYPDKLHFDLSLHVAKCTLKLLANNHERTEKVYDENGKYLFSQIINGMDDESAEFYIRTMSSNLRGFFNKKPKCYFSQYLAKLAKKGLLNAHYKSFLTISEIELALLSYKNYQCNISHAEIKNHAATFNISFKESNYQLDLIREHNALANPARGSLGRKQRRLIETIALHSGLVGNGGKSKCTYYAHNDWKKRDFAAEEWMKNHVISNGKVKLSLADIGKSKKKSLSEMYCIALGIQKVAEDSDRQWASVVCTLKSEKHPNPANGKNSWDGTTPDKASKTISKKFARVRAVLAKVGISLSGFWTRESHLDATPHINFLVYFPRGTAAIVERAFRMHYDHGPNAVQFLKGEVDTLDDGNKPCAFATYAMKYFLKFFNENPSKDAIDESAWASTWGIRRIAFIGLPSLEIWRGMRKSIKPIIDPSLEQLRQYCRRNDAENWIKMCGGLNVKRSKRDFKSLRDNASHTVIGVEHSRNREKHIYKKIGEWSIEKAKVSINIQPIINQVINIKLSVVEDGEVTLSQNYPRKAVNTKSTNVIINKTTPKIQTFPSHEQLFATNKLIHDSRLNTLIN